MIGTINAYHARLAERAGYKAIYLSGGGVAAGSLGMPDLGITTLDDVLTDVRRITDVCDLPLLVDVDTGFGRRLQHRAHRQVADQVRRGARCTSRTRSAPSAAATAPARKSSPQEEMVDRIKAAVDARTDPEFVIMARTDALAVEGLEAAIDRAGACVEAGADMIFPEAMTELAHVPEVRRRGEGAGPGQHHRVRRDAAVHRRRNCAAPASRWCCIRCRRSAR